MLPSGDLEFLKPLFTQPLAGTQVKSLLSLASARGPLRLIHKALMSTIPRERAASFVSM